MIVKNTMHLTDDELRAELNDRAAVAERARLADVARQRAESVARVEAARAATEAADADRERAACACCAGRGYVHPREHDEIAELMVERQKRRYREMDPDADLDALRFSRPALRSLRPGENPASA